MTVYRARFGVVVAAVVVFGVALPHVGCQNEEIARTEPSGGKSRDDRDDDDDDDRYDGNDADATPQGPTGTMVAGGGGLPFQSTGTFAQAATGTGVSGLTAAEGEGPVEFPALSFNGTGYTTYKMDDRLAMTQTVNTRLDELALTLDTTAAHVDCGDLNGCNQREVDEKVQQNSIGATVYDRASKAEVEAAKASGFRQVPFTLFAKSARAKNGITFTFASYLPVFPWPGTAARYTDLDAGPITWTARVTASQALSLSPHLVDAVRSNPSTFLGNGQAVQEFTATITVSKAASDASSVTLAYDLTIAEDKDRMLYKYFPISKRAEYRVDTTARNVTQIVATGWSNGDRSKEEEESVNTFKLCTKTTASAGTQTFPCQ
jgi:hypothetical protein